MHVLDVHEPPLPKDGEAVGDLLDFREDVSREDDRLAAGLRLAHQRQDVAPGGGVEGGGRLVQDEDLHRVGERLRSSASFCFMPVE